MITGWYFCYENIGLEILMYVHNFYFCESSFLLRGKSTILFNHKKQTNKASQVF